MSTRRVLRYEVPVDGQSHEIAVGPVLMTHPWRQAQTSPAGRVEVWVEASTLDDWPDGPSPKMRRVQVFGTGQPIPADATWLGSCTDGPLVWHVYEIQEQV